MSKYYTPTIEEFHVGFEFESNYTLFSKDREWTKCKLDENNTWFIEEWYVDAVPTEFRVKYLDREDIESLGFEHTDGNDRFAWFKSGKWIMQFNVGHCHIHTGNDMLRHFSGYIKNKSELKRILKQICYEAN